MTNPVDKLTVLIADDNETMRRLLGTLLAALGAGRIFFAENGQDALKSFFRYCPDLIITDAAMAPIDGYELIDTVRTHPGSPDPHVPIIMLSALSHEDHDARARAMGVTLMMRKPLAPPTLYAAINEALTGAARTEWLASESARDLPKAAPVPRPARSRMLH